MFFLNGVGWINKAGYGTSSGWIKQNPNSETMQLPVKREVFQRDIKHFGRFDFKTQKTCFTIGLALKDMGLPQDGEKHRIGIIGLGGICYSSSEISEYYQNYYKNHKTPGEKEFFKYTHPVGALTEASAYFGLMGPLYYLTVPDDEFKEGVQAAKRMIVRQEALQMLVGTVEEICFYMVVGPEIRRSICPVSCLNFDLPKEKLIQCIIKMASLRLENRDSC